MYSTALMLNCNMYQLEQSGFCQQHKSSVPDDFKTWDATNGEWDDIPFLTTENHFMRNIVLVAQRHNDTWAVQIGPFSLRQQRAAR